MTLVKWTPKRNVMSLFDDVEQMISQAFNYPLQTENGSLSYSPLMNINEADGKYLVTMDLPGVDKKDVEVNVSDGILTASGERKVVYDIAGCRLQDTHGKTNPKYCQVRIPPYDQI